VLSDPRATRPSAPLDARRLSEIDVETLRVACLRCERTVEIRTADAIRLYDPGSTWRDVGRHLLERGCQNRTGRHEEDGCWPDYGPR
jgi:hypothetical protein